MKRKQNSDPFLTVTIHRAELPPELFDDDALIDEKLTAALIDRSVSLLRKWRADGNGDLPFVKDPADGSIRYRRGDVRRKALANLVKPACA